MNVMMIGMFLVAMIGSAVIYVRMNDENQERGERRISVVNGGNF